MAARTTPSSGWATKLMIGIGVALVATVVTGLVGYGSLQSDVAHGREKVTECAKRLEDVSSLQFTDGRDLTALKEATKATREDVADIKAMIQELRNEIRRQAYRGARPWSRRQPAGRGQPGPN